jgi:hypothetical protein
VASSKIRRCGPNRARTKRHGRRLGGAQAQARAMVHGFRRDFFLQDRGEEGSSPEVVLERGRRQFGLAVAYSFSIQRQPVVALSSGSSTEVRDKMGVA